MRIRSFIMLTLAFLTATSVLFFFLFLHMFNTAAEKNEVSNYAEKAALLQKIFRKEAGYYRLLTAEHTPMIDTEGLMKQMQSEYELHRIPSPFSKMTNIQFMGVFSEDFSHYYAASSADFEATAEETLINILKVSTEIKGFVEGGGDFFTVAVPSKGHAVLLGIIPVESSTGKGYLLTGYRLDGSFITAFYSSFGIEAGVAGSASKTKPRYEGNADAYTSYSVELLSRSAARINITLTDLKGAEVLHIFFPVKRRASMTTACLLNTPSLYFVFFSVACLSIVFLLFYLKIALPVHKQALAPSSKPEPAEHDYSKADSHDTQSGILNMRFFDEIFFLEWHASIRNNIPIGLIIADIDNFKMYNREYGYSEGDKCIALIGELIKEAVKDRTDMIVRRGGEEFMILLPATDKKACTEAAEEILAAVRKRSIPNTASEEKIVTLSIGACSLIPSKDDSKELLVLNADQALYNAKKRKNGAEVC